MQSKPSSVHTTPSKNVTGWTNTSSGQSLGTYRTQAEAIQAGRAHAQASGAEHRIHGRNGQIREANSYGPDPHPPRG